MRKFIAAFCFAIFCAATFGVSVFADGDEVKTIESDWNNQDITIKFFADPDTYSGQQKVEYRINGSEWLATASLKQITLDTSTTLQLKSTDNAGNVSYSGKYYYKVNKIAPSAPTINNVDSNVFYNTERTVTITDGTDISGTGCEIDKTEYVGNSGGWSAVWIGIDKKQPTAPTITARNTAGQSIAAGNWSQYALDLNITRNSTAVSGIAYYEYSLNGGESWIRLADNISKVTFAENTTTDVRVRAVSGSGMKGVQAIFKVMVDVNDPTKPQYIGKNTSRVIASGVWSNTPLTMTYSGSAAYSGIAKYQFSYNGTNWYDCNSADAVVFQPTFNTPLYGRAVSVAGRTSVPTDLYNLRVDTVALASPTITAVNAAGAVGSGQWSPTDLTVKIGSLNAFSGISGYEYSTDGGKTWNKYVAATGVVFNRATKCALQARGISNAGTIGAVSVYDVRVDKTSPLQPILTAQETISGGKEIKSNEWTSNGIALTMTAFAPYSGINRIEYSFDNMATWTTYAGKLNIIDRTFVHARVISNSGLISDITQFAANVDSKAPAAPVITAVNSKGAVPTNTWSSEAVVYKISASSQPVSGIAKVQYSFDGGISWKTYSEPFTLTGSGNIRITARITSNSGLYSDSVYISKIDTIAPTSPIITGNISTGELQNGVWTNEDVHIGISGSTAFSGIAKYLYSTDDGATWQEYNDTTMPVCKEYKTYLAVAISNSGLRGGQTSYVARVDQTPPTMRLEGIPTSWVRDANIAVNPADSGGSGLKSVTVQVPNAAEGILYSPYVIHSTHNGVYTITAKDAAGNVSIWSQDIKYIDGNAPGISYTIEYSKDLTAAVINVTASDYGLSGVKSITMPTGEIVYKETLAYPVDKNGTYYFATEDNAGNVSYAYPVSVAGIIKSGEIDLEFRLTDNRGKSLKKILEEAETNINLVTDGTFTDTGSVQISVVSGGAIIQSINDEAVNDVSKKVTYDLRTETTNTFTITAQAIFNFDSIIRIVLVILVPIIVLIMFLHMLPFAVFSWVENTVRNIISPINTVSMQEIYDKQSNEINKLFEEKFASLKETGEQAAKENANAALTTIKSLDATTLQIGKDATEPIEFSNLNESNLVINGPKEYNETSVALILAMNSVYLSRLEQEKIEGKETSDKNIGLDGEAIRDPMDGSNDIYSYENTTDLLNIVKKQMKEQELFVVHPKSGETSKYVKYKILSPTKETWEEKTGEEYVLDENGKQVINKDTGLPETKDITETKVKYTVNFQITSTYSIENKVVSTMKEKIFKLTDDEYSTAQEMVKNLSTFIKIGPKTGDGADSAVGSEAIWALIQERYSASGADFTITGPIGAPFNGWNNSQTSPPGPRYSPITGKSEFHAGTDIGAATGTPIYAGAQGIVTAANGSDISNPRGYYVVITYGRKDGLLISMVYQHLAFPPPVDSGETVSPGQEIGEVGSTGDSTGPHLHMEYWEENNIQNSAENNRVSDVIS